MNRRGFTAVVGSLLFSRSLWAGFLPGAAFPVVQVGVGAAGIGSLRREPRRWVDGVVRVDAGPGVPVRVRLKGRTGSFRPVDGTPGLTLDAGEAEILPGVKRLHLENAVEDPGRLDAMFGAEAFGRLGFVTPRVGWARVEWEGRKLGWYVTHEAFGGGFAKWAGWGGDDVLAEPVEGADLGGELDFKNGTPEARERARVAWTLLARAAGGAGDPAVRWAGLGRWVDTDRFLRFVASEVILSHRDGYSLARNNYRLRFVGERVEWVPWGMDQLLGVARLPLRPQMGGALAALALEATGDAWDVPVDAVAGAVFRPREWDGWLEDVRMRARPHLRTGERRELGRALDGLRGRLEERGRVVRESQAGRLRTWRPGVGESLEVRGWRAVDVAAQTAAGEGIGPGAVPGLWLRAEGASAGAWRSTVRLAPGRYRFEGRVAVEGVEETGFGEHRGAALRLLGGDDRSEGLTGDGNWRLLTIQFRVVDRPRDVALVCELRARAGRAWFDRASLKLVRVE